MSEQTTSSVLDCLSKKTLSSPHQVKSNDHLIEFEYDGDGKRIAKIVDGIKTYYINDATFPISQVLMEVNEKQEPQSSYIYAERRLGYWTFMDYYFSLSSHSVMSLSS